MKHTWKMTIILLFTFLVAQAFGLFTVSQYIEVLPVGAEVNGVILEAPEIVHEDTLVGPAPEFQGAAGFLTVIIAVIVGTLILLVLAKFKVVKLWKLWFFLSVFITSALALDVYVPVIVALVLGMILAALKIYKSNIFTHNVTEVLMYTGIAILFVSFFNLFWAVALLIVISMYDMYAVWMSKHMVTLAKFTMDTGLFAGLNFPYHKKSIKMAVPTKTSIQEGSKKVSSAILGGGDIAFPLIFASVVMEHLITVKQVTKIAALNYSYIISIGAMLGLLFLFYRSEKGKFYPAMPFVSVGCFLGYGLIVALL